MQASRLLSFSSNSPTFDSFSSAVDLAAIATRVVEEFRGQLLESNSHRDDDDFEFAFHCPTHNSSHPVATADEIFFNGQIRPLNPYGGKGESQLTPSLPKSTLPRRHQPALRKLMSEERDPISNSASEEEEDLTSVPPETYCIWTPKQNNSGGLSSSPSRSKIKYNSSGFSKQWKLRNFLYVKQQRKKREARISSDSY